MKDLRDLDRPHALLYTPYVRFFTRPTPCESCARSSGNEDQLSDYPDGLPLREPEGFSGGDFGHMCTLHSTPSTSHTLDSTLHPTPDTPHLIYAPYTLHLIPHTLYMHPTPHNRLPTSYIYTLRPTLDTQHLIYTPCALHLTSNTLYMHPTPYT